MVAGGEEGWRTVVHVHLQHMSNLDQGIMILGTPAPSVGATWASGVQAPSIEISGDRGWVSHHLSYGTGQAFRRIELTKVQKSAYRPVHVASTPTPSLVVVVSTAARRDEGRLVPHCTDQHLNLFVNGEEVRRDKLLQSLHILPPDASVKRRVGRREAKEPAMEVGVLCLERGCNQVAAIR